MEACVRQRPPASLGCMFATLAPLLRDATGHLPPPLLSRTPAGRSSGNKYRLSQIDPRDKIVPQTELGDLCDKLYSGRASELGGIINLVDQRLSGLSRSETLELSRAKLIARSTIDMPWRNFLSPKFRKKFQRKVPLFL